MRLEPHIVTLYQIYYHGRVGKYPAFGSYILAGFYFIKNNFTVKIVGVWHLPKKTESCPLNIHIPKTELYY